MPFTEALVGKLPCGVSTCGIHAVPDVAGGEHTKEGLVLRGELLQKRLPPGRAVHGANIAMLSITIGRTPAGWNSSSEHWLAVV